MPVENIIKGVKIVDSDVVQITKYFADKNLSKTCLKLADNVTDKHYEWTLESGAYMVMFELPSVFKVDFMEITNLLGFYCEDYVSEMKLTGDNLLSVFKKNFSKKINF